MTTAQKRVAWVFPGQGSQVVGMGQNLAARYPEARAVFKEADAVLGYSLSQICFEGPSDLLTRTDNAQPALLTTSIAHLKVLQKHFPDTLGDGQPLFVAGHSLGEYTALVAAGSLSFADALTLVRERGNLMQAQAGGTGMSAVIGADDDVIEEICAASGAEVANYNSPGQVVVSGPMSALEKLAEIAKTRGIKRVIPLPVGAAFHSSLMRPMADRLSQVIYATPFKDAQVPVVSNVTGNLVTAAGDIMKKLVLQTYSAVRWVDSTRRMWDGGATEFIEIGPGKVLTGLIKRIEKSATLVNSEDILK